jgi:GAF domain-containing protein
MPEPGSANPTPSMIAAFSEIAQHVLSSEDPEDSMQRITETARDAIRRGDSASLSLLTPDGAITRGATDQLARAGTRSSTTRAKAVPGRGDAGAVALRTGRARGPALAALQRAARRGGRRRQHGQLPADPGRRPNHTLGGMNLYSTVEHAFTEEDQMLAILLASLGAVVVDASRQQAHLRAAIESRQVIGEAIGIIKAQGGVSSDQAFVMLSKASQRMNLKLRELARRIADGEQPVLPGSERAARRKPPSTAFGRPDVE